MNSNKSKFPFTKNGSFNSNWLKDPDVKDYLDTLFPDDNLSVQQKAYLYLYKKSLEDYPGCENCLTQPVSLVYNRKVREHEFRRFCSEECRLQSSNPNTNFQKVHGKSNPSEDKSIVERRTKSMKSTKNSPMYQVQRLEKDLKELNLSEESLRDLYPKHLSIPSRTLLNWYKQSIDHESLYCLNCGAPLSTSGMMFCSVKCNTHHRVAKQGYESYFASEEWKSKSHLYPQPMRDQKIQEHRKKMSMERYGVPHHKSNPDFDNSSPVLKAWETRNPALKDLDLSSMKDYLDESGFLDVQKFSESLGIGVDALRNRASLQGVTLPPFQKKTLQREILEFLMDVGLQQDEVIYNTKSVIPPLELDLFIPKLNLAIEFHGMMFHSFGISKHSMFNNHQYIPSRKNYHLDKYLLCAQKDIQLLQIFENEWLEPRTREIWKSMITSKVQLSSRIYARKCEVREVDNQTSRGFLHRNHLQGSIGQELALGLYHENGLLALMTFGQSRFEANQKELLRFCNFRGTTVVGGASRLLHHYQKTYHDGSIVSYANRRWSNGNLYQQLGFQPIKQRATPNYFYFHESNPNQLYSRQVFMKHKIRKYFQENKYRITTFLEKLSEMDNMMLNGYRVIFDAGSSKFMKF